LARVVFLFAGRFAGFITRLTARFGFVRFFVSFLAMLELVQGAHPHP